MSTSDPRQCYHHQVVLNTVHSNKISPTWPKVSKSPFEAHSKKVSGYGRQIQNISISQDCPTTFIQTDHLKRPIDAKPLPREFASRRTSSEGALVLPGGTYLEEQPTHGRKYVKIKLDNQLYLEPTPTQRPGNKINLSWNSDRNAETNKANMFKLPQFSPIKPRCNDRPCTGSQNFKKSKSAHSSRIQTALPSSRVRSGGGITNTCKISDKYKKSWWLPDV